MTTATGRSTAGVVLVAIVALATACGSPNGEESSTAVGRAPIEVEIASVTLSPGDVSEGTVTVEGTAIDYVIVAPADFEPGATAPVLLAMPPGGQDLTLTRRVIDGTYAAEALARGWVVVSPAAPDGRLYSQGSEALIPGLLEWMAGWVDIEGGRPHLAGISNGGLSAFRLAADQPDGFASIVAFPGFPRTENDRAALERLTGIPIRLFVGETDSGWVAPMEDTFETLTALDGDVTLEIVPGEGHVIGALSDGVRIFDELDAAR